MDHFPCLNSNIESIDQNSSGVILTATQINGLNLEQRSALSSPLSSPPASPPPLPAVESFSKGEEEVPVGVDVVGRKRTSLTRDNIFLKMILTFFLQGRGRVLWVPGRPQQILTGRGMHEERGVDDL